MTRISTSLFFLYGLDFFFKEKPRDTDELREMISEIFARRVDMSSEIQ